LLEKRSYASMMFFLFYLLGSLIGTGIFLANSSNELLLILNPSEVFVLLLLLCTGDYNIILDWQGNESPIFIDLKDGKGLEAIHIWLYVGIWIAFFASVLAFRLKKQTTEGL